MNNLFTIGFTKKSAKYFFELLKNNSVKTIVDVRLNNSSQLAGFSKGEDLKYFLNEICNIDYVHEDIFAPTKEILDAYKKGTINWKEYETEYTILMEERNIQTYIKSKGIEYWNATCLLCSEDKPDCCHRRLATNEIKKVYPEFVVNHLI